MSYLRRLCLLFFIAFSIFALNGNQTVVTSGVPVQLVTVGLPINCTILTIQALSTNTGTIWFGFGSNVSAANKRGIALGPPITAGQPGGAYALFPVGNAQFWSAGSLWIDATNSGDGVSFTCGQ